MGRLIRPTWGTGPDTIEAPDLLESSGTQPGRGWIVIVFNNEKNTYDEVIEILLRATGCDIQEAYIETWEIDHLGQSVVHQADRPECDRAAKVIATIGIRVEVQRDE